MVQKKLDANGRVTLAVVGQKVDDMSARFDRHDQDGRDVLQRLSALEGKVWVIFWGTPVLISLTGIALALFKYVVK